MEQAQKDRIGRHLNTLLGLQGAIAAATKQSERRVIIAEITRIRLDLGLMIREDDTSDATCSICDAECGGH